jgi:hypothetical protein
VQAAHSPETDKCFICLGKEKRAEARQLETSPQAQNWQRSRSLPVQAAHSPATGHQPQAQSWQRSRTDTSASRSHHEATDRTTEPKPCIFSFPKQKATASRSHQEATSRTTTENPDHWKPAHRRKVGSRIVDLIYQYRQNSYF